MSGQWPEKKVVARQREHLGLPKRDSPIIRHTAPQPQPPRPRRGASTLPPLPSEMME